MTERISIDLDPGIVDSLAMWLIPWLRPTPAEIAAEIERQREPREPEAGL